MEGSGNYQNSVEQLEQGRILVLFARAGQVLLHIYFETVMQQFWLVGASTPGQSGTGSNGHEGVPRISQSFSITGTSSSDCLVSYSGHLLGVGVLPL